MRHSDRRQQDRLVADASISEQPVLENGTPESVGMPVAISFTVETDGKLPTGQTLKDAIESVDEATSNAPAYYPFNRSRAI